MSEVILKNGNFFVNNKEMFPGSLAISEGKIRELNNFTQLQDKYKGAKVIDIEGKYVFPGFIDSHVHLMRTGFLKTHVDLADTSSVDDILSKIKAQVDSKKPGEWVVGCSLEENNLVEQRYPTKEELDKVAPDNPVALIRVCTHLLAVNSKALSIANIDAKTEDPDGGEIEKESSGEPTGILKRTAGNLIFAILNADREMNKRSIKAGMNYFKEHGITSVHSMAINVKEAGDYFSIMSAIREALEEEGYPLRVIQGSEFEILDHLVDRGYKFLQGDEYLKQGYIKFYTDGSLGTRTALMFEPYSDDPGNCGIQSISPNELYHYVKKADDNGYQCAIHALGDKGLDHALEVLERVISNRENSLRHRIVHAGVINDSLVKRMANLNISVDIQPNFLASDIKWLDSALGDRAKDVYAWKTMIDYGITLAASSDSPVEPIYPFYGIRTAIKRQNLLNFPEGGFNPQEQVSLEDMLKMYTINGAYEYFEEDQKGSITPGKLADLVVLSDNPFALSADELVNISIFRTIVGGREVFVKGH